MFAKFQAVLAGILVTGAAVSWLIPALILQHSA